ncbi:hypothetical protein TrispH2_007542 [Trichoplax sp. H2]|nr:hypothetical protein TrispH2_007542 [Trichoplax sp. H2]|eukprot:RDD39825.1 hypothetical protein TrispH2_007542 [Trichoplax sp. H2]
MSNFESLDELKALKRPQLQKLCKKHGIKAAGKNIELIAALKRILLKPKVSGNTCMCVVLVFHTIKNGKIEPESICDSTTVRRQTYDKDVNPISSKENQDPVELQVKVVNDNLSVGKVQADLMMELGERVAARKALGSETDTSNSPSIQKPTKVKEKPPSQVSDPPKTRKRAQKSNGPTKTSNIAKKSALKKADSVSSSKKPARKATKLPDFKKLHAQNFSKFGESLDTYLDKKNKRRQYLTQKLQNSVEKRKIVKEPTVSFSSQIPVHFNFSLNDTTKTEFNNRTPSRRHAKTPNKKIRSTVVSSKQPKTPMSFKTPNKRMKNASINQAQTPLQRVQFEDSAFQRRKNYDLCRRKSIGATSAKKLARERIRSIQNHPKDNTVSHEIDVKKVKVPTREQRRNNALKDRSKKRNDAVFARRGIQLR